MLFGRTYADTDTSWMLKIVGHTIVVYTGKGGTGKTALSINLANYFASLGIPVILIDGDGQRSASMLCRVPQDRRTMYEVLERENKITLRDILREISPNLWLAPGSNKLWGWRYNADGANALRRVLTGAKGFLRIIDSGPAWTDLSEAAVETADRLICPMQPSTDDIVATHQLLTMLLNDNGWQHSLKANQVGMVFTRVRKRTNLHRTALARADQIPYHVFNTQIYESIAVQEASDKGKAIVTHNPRHQVAQQYATLAQEIAAWTIGGER